MHAASIIAFNDEMAKIAANLNVAQMKAQGLKAIKRGWSGERATQSTLRLLSRDEKPAFYAANKARSSAVNMGAGAAAGGTAIGRAPRPRPAPRAAQPGVNTQTVMSPAKPAAAAQPMSRFAKGLGVGIGGALGGAGLEHLHQKRQENANERSFHAGF